MRIVVGLGNPGAQYARTRHNVGFLALDELARRGGAPLRATPANHVGDAVVHGHPVMLVKPQMFMNRSGDALAHIEPLPSARDLIVIHDDLDLELATVRVKQGGGTGGHRGLDSLAACFGEDFTRVRIGIGRPANRNEVVDFVLSPFADDQNQTVTQAVRDAAAAVECILDQGETTAMNRFNARRRTSTAIAETLTGRP